MIHCNRCLWLKCFILVLALSFQIGCAARKPIGRFDYPTGVYKAADYTQFAGWLDGCAGSRSSKKRCHLGIDIRADEGAGVYPISGGRIVAISASGWNCRGTSGNVGVVVQHELEDGTEFLALYGHVRTKLTVDDTVCPGKSFATVGQWCNGNHLHFGIHPGLTMPATNWGSLPCGKCKDHQNGFVDPLEFLRNHRPQAED
jgi:murein DD-endopeptidase MepM/ murein hydrolase activator NlpD